MCIYHPHVHNSSVTVLLLDWTNYRLQLNPSASTTSNTFTQSDSMYKHFCSLFWNPKWNNSTHLFTIFVSAATRPKEMGADTDGSALVRLFQQLGGSQSTLSPQRLVVFLTETSHSLESSNDQCDGCQLSFGVADLILVQGEGLVKGMY